MSDEKPKAEASAEGAAPKKKGGKLIPVVAALMVAEAAGVYFIVSTINKKPAAAQATELKEGHEQKEDEMVEIPLIEDQFQNMQTGRVWLWDASIAVRTKKKFSYASIALILGSPEALVRAEVEKAREFLLGRRLKAVEWSEEDF